MRALIVLGACAGLGCASPREKDCKALLPLVDEARAARRLELADGGLAQTRFASRPERAAAAIRALPLHDQALTHPAGRLAAATDAHAKAMVSLDRLVAALETKPRTDLDPAAAFADVEAAKPHVEVLVRRCGLPGLPAAPDAGNTECAALAGALERCVTPESDTTTAEEQLLVCAAAFEAVPSDDPGARAAVLGVAAALRKLEPVARQVGAPAKKALAVAMQLAPEVNTQTAARVAAEKAEAEIRTLCQPAVRGGTSGPP